MFERLRSRYIKFIFTVLILLAFAITIISDTLKQKSK